MSDQKKLQKAEDLYKKGVQSEAEADNTSESRKSQLKHLEAAEYYRNFASDEGRILKNNIKSFWKKYQGNKNELESVKMLEEAALDSLKFAEKIRDQVEKEKKIEQRIVLLRKAEKVENNSLLRLQKVLYTYINLPVHYDEKWIISETNTIPVVNIEKKVSLKGNGNNTDTIADVKKSVPQANDSGIYGIVKVNEEQIDKFNEFLKKTYPSDVEKYVINFSELDYSDVNQLKDAWYKYQFGTDAINPSNSLMADNSKDSVSASSDIQTASSSGSKSSNTTTEKLSYAANSNEEDPGKDVAAKSSKVNQQRENIDSSNSNEKALKTDKQTSANMYSSVDEGEKSKDIDSGQQKSVAIDKSLKTTKGNKANNKVDKEIISGDNIVTGKNEARADFIYRIQIAACRIPMDQKVLQDIYNGPEKVVELEEDLWYKYAIGKFSTYKEAHEFAESSKIPGAFVISYLNGKRIKITSTAVSQKGASLRESVNSSGEIEFRVQIAASKSQIPDHLLKNIYNDIKSLKIISENGWYKYSLSAGKTVDEARTLIKTLNIPGAFVIAYQNGVKIELAEAVKLTNN